MDHDHKRNKQNIICSGLHKPNGLLIESTTDLFLYIYLCIWGTVEYGKSKIK